MRDSFSKLHPAVLISYFLVQTVMTAVCFHPVIIGISLFCALIYVFICVGAKQGFMWVIISMGYILGFGFINPLINHQGATVLLTLFDRNITLQSLCYGLTTGAMIDAMCLWLYITGKTLDSKKAVYIFGKGMPALTLMVFISLRLLKRYQTKAREILEARQAMNMNEGKINTAKKTGGSLLTYALENGVITADSMTARGYGVAKPTAYYNYHFTFKDMAAAAVMSLATVIMLWGIFRGCCKMYFYPVFFTETTSLLVYFSYMVLGIYPLAVYIWSEIKWMLLK